MKLTKALFTVLWLFAIHITLFAGGTNDSTAPLNQKARVVYPTTIEPGDPLFVEVFFSKKQKELQNFFLTFYKKETNKTASGEGENESEAEKEVIIKTDFYRTDNTEKNYFAAIPLSTFLDAGMYTICLTREYESHTMTDEFTVAVLKKQFTEDIIRLDRKNTAIRTDTSPKRTNQIERLYQIFDTVNYESAREFQHFILPINTERRTGTFGDRRIFRYSNGGEATNLHHGVDFGVPVGTPIVSCADGKVVLAEERISTGFSIIIEHLPGLYSIYYHLDSLAVVENQEVTQGEHIGLSGETGMVTGPHLHWEVRLLGQSVDPDYFIKKE